MKKIFIALSAAFLLSWTLPVESIYIYQQPAADGSTIVFNDFQQKKILLVNIATGSDKVAQLAELQQLQQQHADSLIVIGFPTNSFGNEPRTDSAIRTFCATQYNVSFRLAAKGDVLGAQQIPVYTWLTRRDKNGHVNSQVQGDFQKYLLDRNGDIIGAFSGATSVNSTAFQQALTY